uniref:Fasciclin-like protein FLA21 n=1 Tax=Triticum aestivum TaxID=4565 RepID=Q06I85_WHEAT|nr:fasciclin-like protein FLA21 [Triticum aestivum]
MPLLGAGEAQRASLAGAALASCSILLLLLVPCAPGPGATTRGAGGGLGRGATTGGVGGRFDDALIRWRVPRLLRPLAMTAGVGDAFREQIGSDLGLTILCPDDEAVGAFMPRFHNLTADEQVAVLLYHGLTMAYSEELLSWVTRVHGEFSTLDGEDMLTIRHHRGRLMLSSWPPSSRNKTRITKTVVDDDHLAVYLIDAVLIPADPKPQMSFWGVLAVIVVLLVLLVVGIAAIVLLCHALVYLCSLLPRLGRWCKGRVAAYASAARVTPHAQGQQEH